MLRHPFAVVIVAGLCGFTRAIAVLLGRPACTVLREIARHRGRSGYRFRRRPEAEARRRVRRPKPTKLGRHPTMRAVVEGKLALRWSPLVPGRCSRGDLGARGELGASVWAPARDV